MRSRYGITGKQYDELYRSQFCKCAICNVDLHHVWTDVKKETKAYVDHDHATGQVRGLLCFHCNVGLGSFGDSIENLISAMAYLSAAVSKSEFRK
jgi:GH24 family phage-related lysozyme (muramidase)